MSSGAALPTLLASTRPLLGQSFVDKKSDLALLERYSAPKEVESWLERASAHGVRGISTLMDDRILGPLRRRDRAEYELVPTIPNVFGVVRQATEHGLIGAGMRLALGLGLGNLVRLGLRSMGKAPAVLKKDFPAMLQVLCDLELGLFKRFQPRVVFLHPQVADLALAFGNRRIFDDFAAIVRKRLGAEAGICTHNFGQLAGFLGDSEIQWVQTPVNAAGWRMKPSLQECASAIDATRFQIVADHPSQDAPPTQDAIDATLAHAHVKSVVLNVADWERFGIASSPAPGSN